MGCGCNKRVKLAVTSVNEAELAAQQQASQNAMAQEMASLRAAVHNANSEVVVASPGKVS